MKERMLQSIDQNRFEVRVRIHDEEELYHSFDPVGTRFSAELEDYILEILKDRGYVEKMLLHIISDSEIDEGRLHDAIRRYVAHKITEYEREKSINRLNALRLFLIGLAIIIVGVLLYGHIGTIPTTIIETVGSFSIWEAANIWLQELPRLRHMERIIKYLSKPEIKVDVLT